MIWLPQADLIPIPGATGTTHQRVVDKLVLHTTEGTTIGGAVSAYKQRRVPPHATYDWTKRLLVQHVPLDRAAYSLWHVDRLGCIQVELVGRAVETPTWPTSALERIVEDVLLPIHRRVPTIPMHADVAWLPYPESYGRQRSRLSFGEWDEYRGVLGHSHCPCKRWPWPLSKTNAHGDPGALAVPRMLEIARALLHGDAPPTDKPTDEEDDVMLLGFYKLHNKPAIYAVYSDGTKKWVAPNSWEEAQALAAFKGVDASLRIVDNVETFRALGPIVGPSPGEVDAWGG